MGADRNRPGDAELAAPCGLNCGACRAFVRARDPCPGCRGGDANKPKGRLACAIKNCGELAAGGHRFCVSCAGFPCAELLRLDKRYRTTYGVAPIANLIRIRDHGIESFVAEENEAWRCRECGTRLCMHRPRCDACGHPWRSA
jgi:hypothetical protein